MKILLDNIIFSLQKNGGISVLWVELLKHLYKKKEEINLNFIEYDNYKENLPRKDLSISAKIIYLKSSSFLSIKRFFSPKVPITNKTIFHSSYYRIIHKRNVLNISTVHDFTYEYFTSGIKRKLHSWQKFKALKKSEYIICVSENTKKDLLKFIPQINEEKIRVIYNGVCDDYYPLEKKVALMSNLPFKKKSFVLFVGGRKGYKNFSFAVKSVKGTGYKLVVVGSSLDKKEKVLLDKNLGVDNYKTLSHISNELLNVLYNNAFCLLYPSSYEGFGIPIIEAQRSGCPVIAFNRSSIPEILSDSGLLINELNTKETQEYFNLLENKKNRNDIIDKGFKNAKRFSWNKMAKETMELYHEASKKLNQ